MRINEVNLEKVENGTIVKYWEEGEQKTKVFTDQKKLFEFLKKVLGKEK